MRLALRQRLLVAAGLGAGVCTLVALGMVVMSALSGWRIVLSDLTLLVSAEELHACQQAPSTWRAPRGVYGVYAYDATGRSHNPGAPPLPPALAAPGWGRSHWQRSDDLWQVQAAQRVADDGPCAILYAHPRGAMPMAPRVGVGTVVGAFLGMLLAMATTLALAVRPLVARLERLDASAVEVGRRGFTPPTDELDDEIGRIGGNLARAHERILADRRELQRRHEALERHLAALAHDLRTPLAALQLSLEALVVDRGHLDALGAARLEVAYLESLADNLHQATRLTSGVDVRTGEVNWTEVVSRVATRFGILGRASGTEVQRAVPDEAVWAGCVPALAERALANVVHNAVLHGGRQVGVVLERCGDRFRITIQDDGTAPDEATLQMLSRRRLSHVMDDHDGISRRMQGLGVAIANEVAHRAGWELCMARGATGGMLVVLEGRCRAGDDGQG
ncbi:MAG: HAMP domain-containing histidine kinase [Myxococcales bacterium]|nr:HAMP domain-containing histidine kinase [Myxococcales bacterium]